MGHVRGSGRTAVQFLSPEAMGGHDNNMDTISVKMQVYSALYLVILSLFSKE